MSIEALTWALDEAERRELDPGPRFVLIILANRADEVGGQLFPSHGHVARRTGIRPSTVRRHIDTLEELGFLRKEKRIRDHDGSQTSNSYQLAMPVDNSEIEQGVLESSMGGGAHQRAGGVLKSSTQETKEVDPLSKRRAQRTNIPENFVASAAVLAWARSKGVDQAYVASCLEAFILDAGANARRYANWDQALMNWIRREPSFQRPGLRPGAPKSASAPTRCAYCTAAATGSVGGIDHCRDHAYDAMDRKPMGQPA